ncbi:contractile injection system protein, VgrG/Pvc8 family [Paraburkholderia atlantica]|uniref:contractile injection system protein, VgrG/Pvc8 family n=1 Tax=Paraburkholderia atlantica TaxID=2654982 RepID=UPI00160C6DAE|nr:contractile injection system protein, VgrG/Pvc8 family [Paraburkholderia atlantica]MBB5508163.1 phage protein D [Paraburkholderia atlantica]
MAYLNQVPAQSTARQPRALVKINDTIVPGWVDWTVDSNSFYSADTFRVRFSTSLLPDAFDVAWFSTVTEAFVEIFAGFPADPTSFTAGELTSLIYGRIDDIDFDPCGTCITITGRDLTAALIDTKLTDQWNNLTASEVATQLANKHGLTPQVTKTTEIVGKYYQIDHVRINAERSEWDLLAWLAAEEGFVVYAKGHTLYFGADPRTPDTPYLVRWQAPDDNVGYATMNGGRIRFSRSLTVAKGVTVVVHSWNNKQKQGFDAYYPSKPKAIQAGKSSPFGNTQTYEFNIHGLTQQQATARAQALYNQIIRHEVKMQYDAPADDLLTARVMIQTEGFPGNFNQTFYVDSVTREFSLDTGYSMHARAKNHNPDLQVQSA